MARRRIFGVSLVFLTWVVAVLIAYPGLVLGSEPVAVSAGLDSTLDVTISVSAPSNGSFLQVGEKAEITVTLKDKSGASLSKADFATLGLYAYGPQETAKTVSAVKLLNATTDRTKTPHHYIDLLANADVRVEGNALKYTLQPVTDEEAGTYTATVRAVKKGATPKDQALVLVDFQLGTATVEQQIIDKENCAKCHQGASNGQFYFAHTDVSERSPYGSPSLDNFPVRTCKNCHNNEGYAAFTSPADGTRVPDQIVRRVHGIHMGEELQNTINTDPKTGVFRDYTGVIFPANVKNCSACHADDRFKTQPSRLACGTCHDAISFEAAVPQGLKAHPGGPQANDANCATCHTPDGSSKMAISEAHKVSQLMNSIDVSITPPANGGFYTAGETPTVTLVVRDDNGNPIDHTQVAVANFSTAGLFVSGPRARTVPVMTNIARNGDSKVRASTGSTAPPSGGGWTFNAGDTLRIAVNGGSPTDIVFPAGLMTPAQVKDLLASKLSGVTVTNTATAVTIKSNNQGASSRIEIYNSPVTTTMGWKNAGRPYRGGITAGVTMEPYVKVGSLSYPVNDLRQQSDPLEYQDPNVTRNSDNITYQLYDAEGLQPGTYSVYVWFQPIAGRTPNVSRVAIGFMNFQIGTATEEKKVATNCADCHGSTIWHLDEGPQHPEPFDTDYCKACHDYARYQTGDSFVQLAGTSLGGWSGYGAVPIVKRVHNVHRGLYLEHPEQIYAGNPFAFNEVIFPQDIRNCTKCHDAKTTTTAWKEKPARLACMSCHDSDSAQAHAKTMTFYPNPADPWSADKEEACAICHGPGRDFAVEKMHKISNPYMPPYPREPER